VAALFTKFDPRAFLDAERQAANNNAAAELATLAALAERAPNSENQPVRDVVITVVTDGPPVRNLRAGVRAAKPAKPAKDGQQCATGGRADWDVEDWRARFDERAGFLEYDGGWLRDEAEVQAFEACIVEWLNRNPSFSLAGRCAWCGKPETPSAVVLPFGAGEHHTWLHPECWAAWYQSRRAKADMALRRMGIAPGGSLGRSP
jgi:hypothetical protein